MHAPSWRNDISIGNLLSIGAMLLAVGGTWTVTSYRIDAIERDRIVRADKIDARFAELGRSVSDIPQLSYRVTAAEAEMKGFNQRLDNSFRTISDRLDRLAEATAAGTAGLSSQIGALDTKVAVITQRLEGAAPDRRTQFRSNRLATDSGR